MKRSGQQPPAARSDDLLTAVLRWFLVAFVSVHRGWDCQVELQERWLLRQRPWEEHFVHWYDDGTQLHLHGHLVPQGRHRMSVTSTGWCPGETRDDDL